MSEYVELFRSEIDERSVRTAFPEMTDTENPIWAGAIIQPISHGIVRTPKIRVIAPAPTTPPLTIEIR